MGYTYDMSGSLTLSKKLTREQKDTLEKVMMGTHKPSDFPSRYCPWQLGEDQESGDTDELIPNDEVSMGDEFDKWLPFLIDNYFTPWGILLNGTIYSSGSDAGGDFEKTVVEDNAISTYSGDVVYEDVMLGFKDLVQGLLILRAAGSIPQKYVDLLTRLEKFEKNHGQYLA